MSTVKSKNVQIGDSGTATDNFTIYQPAAPDGTLRIGNGNTGTTSAQVVLTSAGNVGIGTSSPSRRLTTRFDSATTYSSSDFDSTSLQLLLDNTNTTTNAFTGINFQVGANSQAAIAAVRAGDGEVAMVFGTRVAGVRAERARIDSSGRLNVNTTGLNAMIGAQNVIGTTPAFAAITTSTNENGLFEFRNPNGLVGFISTSGSSTTYSTSSDYRLKENVAPLTDAIERIKQIPVYRFNFIADPNKIVDGFLAHEAQQIVPESVTGTKDEVEAIGNITDAEGNIVQQGVTEPQELPEGQVWTQTGEQPVYQGIDQSKLVPLLTAALQDAIKRIETLEAQLGA
jgi:hypothetical protein